jgi:beta-phosphoglucomutase
MNMKTNYPFAAVLFDMDGTLVDDVPLHQQVWREFAHRRGLNRSEQELQFAEGRKASEVIACLFGEDLSQEEILRLTQESQSLFRERLASTNVVRLIPGVVEFLSNLGKLGIPRILATDTSRANVVAIFTKFGLSPYFDAVITSEDLQHGKPNPEIYLIAAQRAEAKPEDCLVAEDSAAGVTAAKAARCSCLGLTTTQPEADLKRERADFIASDYTNLPVAIALPWPG